VISLVAKGLTTGEVQAHLAEIYGAEVSRDTFSTITDRVLDGLAEWQSRPLDLHGVRCLGRFRPCPIRTGCPRLFPEGTQRAFESRRMTNDGLSLRRPAGKRDRDHGGR